jgi:hypothetical protein
LFDEEAYYTKVNAFALRRPQGIGVYFLIPENYQEIQEFHHFSIIC